MKTKICGITSLEDALLAVDAGADLLGFNFYTKSPRCIEPSVCTMICRELTRQAPGVVRVGVFVNHPPVEILERLDSCGLDLAQLSGDEPLTDLEALNGRAFKALRLSTDSVLSKERRQVDPQTKNDVDAYLDIRRGSAPVGLVDASVPGQFGGTGVTADWPLAAGLARRAPILLAGGLTPENVAKAVKQVRPWGVDVASGVETAPGKKDPVKVRTFIQNARTVVPNADIRIETASLEDLPEILALQKLAYHSEAVLNDDFGIPPMVQTQAGIEAEFQQRTFLKALQGSRLVGSVRANLENGTCHIGRMIVHPERQNLGIGTRLMHAIETHFAQAQCYELFTSKRSVRNLTLYQKLGYRIFKEEALSEKVQLIYLEKRQKLS
jgi:phosphoribosylanthranilate isomerase